MQAAHLGEVGTGSSYVEASGWLDSRDEQRGVRRGLGWPPGESLGSQGTGGSWCCLCPPGREPVGSLSRADRPPPPPLAAGLIFEADSLGTGSRFSSVGSSSFKVQLKCHLLCKDSSNP